MNKPEIYQLVSFVKDYSWEWNDLTEEQILGLEKDFNAAFTALPAAEQEVMSLEAQSISACIKLLPNLNPGVAIMRQTNMALKVKALMEKVGVIASTKDGGLSRALARLAPLAEDTLGYVTEYEMFAQAQNSKREVSDNVSYAENIISGIRSEVERLKLANPAKSQPKGELMRRRDARHKIKTSISKFGAELENLITSEELIGFNTLNELLKEFHNAKRYLEDAILLLENPAEPLPTIS